MENILTFESFVNESYNKPRAGGKKRWSVKYKKGINCSVATVVKPDAIICNSSVTAIPVLFCPKSIAKIRPKLFYFLQKYEIKQAL